MIRQRRLQVAVLFSKRLRLVEIADSLGVDIGTVSRDIKALKQESRKAVYSLAQDELPFFFSQAMLGVSEVIREAWRVFHESNSEKTKVRCLDLLAEAEGEYYSMLRGGVGVLNMSQMRGEIESLRQEALDWKDNGFGR